MAKAQLDQDLRKVAEAGTRVEIVDSVNGCGYDLISAEQYPKMRVPIIGSDFDPREAYAMVDKIMADDDAQDSLVDSYQ